MCAGPHGETAELGMIKDENKTTVRNCSTSKATGRAKAMTPVITRTVYSQLFTVTPVSA